VKNDRLKKVVFVDQSLYKSFLELKSGKFEEKELASYIQRAINDLKENPFIGIKLPNRLWPKEYLQKFSITNLRKYDLPNGWRLIYTLEGSDIEIVSILLEWFSHKEYERCFGYKSR